MPKRRKPGGSSTSKLEYLEQEVQGEMKTTTYVWNPELKDEALALYLYGNSPVGIARRLKIPVETIRDWAGQEKWATKRAQIFKRAYEQSWLQIGNTAGIAQNNSSMKVSLRSLKEGRSLIGTNSRRLET
jgi:hypothetical protein